MVNILNKTDTAANHFLYEMRHKGIQNDRLKFRNNLKRLGWYMAFEISKSLKYKPQAVETTLGKTEEMLIASNPVLLCILRASLPFFNGFLDVFDQAESGFIGAYREEGEEININLDYTALPDLDGQTVILADPMLATGKSIVDSIKKIENYGSPKEIHIASAIAAPEGIDYISQNLAINHTIWIFSVDQRLNDLSYIVPGLGDAGDLSFGEKK